MANSKITDLTALTTTATGDFVPIVDVSDTTQASSGTTKKITWANFILGITTGFATLTGVESFITGAKTFGAAGDVGKLKIAGTTSGSTILDATAVASGTLTLPATTDTLVGKATTDTLTNKTLTSPTITGTIAGTPTITTPTITKPVMDATNPSAQTYSPSAAGTATLDLSLANEHRITMPAGNITIALTGDTNAQKFIVSILQDATGSRTVTWFSTIRWTSGTTPTLTTTASKRDTFGFIRTGSGTYDGFIIGQNI